MLSSVSSESLITLYQTTQLHTLDDSNPHSSHKLVYVKENKLVL
jgi:hypothetical protein